MGFGGSILSVFTSVHEAFTGVHATNREHLK